MTVVGRLRSTMVTWRKMTPGSIPPLYLEVLHAPVVDELFANLLLAVPVEEQVGQQQQRHRGVENGCQKRGPFLNTVLGENG